MFPFPDTITNEARIEMDSPVAEIHPILFIKSMCYEVVYIYLIYSNIWYNKKEKEKRKGKEKEMEPPFTKNLWVHPLPLGYNVSTK